MATTLYNRIPACPYHTGKQITALNGAQKSTRSLEWGTSRGATVGALQTNTVAGPTSGVETTNAFAEVAFYISDPLAADVTISGTITINVWAAESSMNANVAINARIFQLAPDGTLTEIAKSARVTEVALTTRAVNNFTVTPTSTAMKKGDRLAMVYFGDDAGTMGSGFTFNHSAGAASAGIDGDTYITFTENLTFLTADPSGSQMFLTNTAGPEVGANIEKEMWTSRGAGVANIVRNSAAGWTAPLQWTDSGGGTSVEWYSKGLTAFTLSGLVHFNIRALTSDTLNRILLWAELAVVNNDGSGAVVWTNFGMGGLGEGLSESGGLDTFEVAVGSGDTTGMGGGNLAGYDLAVTDGQRLRFRAYIDDADQNGPMPVSQTATLYYAGTSGGASGDSWLQLTQSVTEFAAAFVPRNPAINHQNPALV